MSERPARYERSFSGLIAAIVVTVLAVGAFVLFTGTFRDPQERGVPTVEYLPLVRDLQASGATVVYPSSLPEGWRSTDVRYEPGEEPRFELNLYTPDDDFVGLRQVAEEVDDVLGDAGVDDASEEDPLSGVEGPVATWQGWADPDGDRAYTAQVRTPSATDTVVVYGDVSAEELADLVRRLTTEPVPDGTRSPAPTSSTPPA
ncbi:DUF4245 family protein [Nocardioides litoris]|uniref:DUF4245 family protein n=1 Tax=Nocardioides litoris TaxID=1926648 RepID=UPI001476CD09|nr:DUF4245 family protein [Nocardioides litoris]